jgi:hypothetical protein
MRLSDAGLRRRQTKLLYPNHRLPPYLTGDDTRARSNRLLERIALNRAQTFRTVGELVFSASDRRAGRKLPGFSCRDNAKDLEFAASQISRWDGTLNIDALPQ